MSHPSAQQIIRLDKYCTHRNAKLSTKSTIYDKIIRCCQINAKLVQKLHFTAKLENSMPNSKNTGNAKKNKNAKQ